MANANGNHLKKELKTFIVYVEDRPGVLNRVASLFRRRSFNIESLTVGTTEKEGISRMTIVIEADDITALHIEAHLYSLVNVLRVDNVTHVDSVERDLALIKVRTTPETRPAIIQLAEVFRGKMVDITTESLVIEVTGPRPKVDAMLDMMRPYGIIEMARTGVVAMGRGPEAPAISPEFVAARVPEEATGFIPRPNL